MTICHYNLTKGNEDMTFDSDRINDVISRILKPQTDEDHILKWTAMIMLIAGIMIG